MEAKNLSFSYNSKSFLENIDLKIEEGKITSILGPNGSGKSTLLNLFVNQICPKNGDIFISGSPLNKMKQKEIAKKIAVVHQHNSAPRDLTIKNLVEFGRAPHQSIWKSNNDDDEIVEWAMKATNIFHMKEKPISQLSGGERQRTWIAMSLAQKTDVLFLDEPTTYLDIAYQIEILELMKKLNSQYKITIVMVLHDINQAIQYSDNILVLRNGQVFYNGKSKGAITEKLLLDVYKIKANICWCPFNKCQYIVPLHLQSV